MFFLILTVWLPFLGMAQGSGYNGNPDTSFFTARTLAFEGKRDIARDTLNHILTKYPDYSDVRSLLASTYSWDGRYDLARDQFNRITSQERQNKEVWVAAIKNEIYSEDYYIALGLSNKALTYLKDDDDIQDLRRKVLENLYEDMKTAMDTAVSTVKKYTEPEIKRNNISMTNSFEVFDAVYGPMVYSSFAYSRKTKAGSVIPRINYANRFETHGLQYELDLYPKFSKNLLRLSELWVFERTYFSRS